MARALAIYFIHQGTPSAAAPSVPPAPGNKVFFTASMISGSGSAGRKIIITHFYVLTDCQQHATVSSREYHCINVGLCWKSKLTEYWSRHHIKLPISSSPHPASLPNTPDWRELLSLPVRGRVMLISCHDILNSQYIMYKSVFYFKFYNNSFKCHLTETTLLEE